MCKRLNQEKKKEETIRKLGVTLALDFAIIFNFDFVDIVDNDHAVY